MQAWTSPVLASGGSGNGTTYRAPAPPLVSDIKAIEFWAEATSFHGVAQVDEFEFGGHEAVVARRSFTSDVETCGLTVFVPARHGWIPSLSIDLTHFWLMVNQDGDWIHLTNSSSKAEVARFSIAQLQANKALQTDGASRRR
jgi:hypothetical protein